MNARFDLSVSRRDFLKSVGALVVAGATTTIATDAFAQTGAAATGKPPLVPGELDSWVAILPDGSVSAFFGKMDMGQSLDVAIAQIVAEELDVPVERVNVLMGDTATSCNQGGASNSSGIWTGAKPLRNAAAEARRVLVEKGAERLGVTVDRLNVDDGVVFSIDDPTKRVSYAELIGGRHFNSKIEWNNQVGNTMDVQGMAKPKPVSAYRVVGKSFPRRDIAGKVFGTTDYVTDISVPGMLHARVIRPPRPAGTIVSVDERSIRAVRGARLLREKNFVAVVAPNEWDAVRAAQMLKVEWRWLKDPFPPMDMLYDHIRAATPAKREEPLKKGDVDAAFKSAARIIEFEYEWPFQSHACMGPACAVVDARKDEATVWTGSQKPHHVRDGVANLLGLPQGNVRSIWVVGPGSYGRNDAGDAALDAALLSKLTGKPVRVQGMRRDGTAWDPKGPASVHRGRAALDAAGKLIGYEFVCRGFSRVNIDTNEADPRDSLVGMELGMAPKPEIGLAVPAENYGIDNKRLVWEVIPALVDHCSPLRTAHFRDPVGPDIHFASEQFIDEIAVAVGEDTVAFRLRYVSSPRDVAVIKAAAEKAGWETRPSPNPKRGNGDILTGRGISYTLRAGTIVATVADIEVNRKTGRIWAKKFTVAHDCGLIINPQGLRYTIEGNVVQGLSRTLFEEVRFDRDSVISVDWTSYPILELGDAPESIEIVLINQPNVAPSGAGEPSIRSIPGAIANAFFDATGVRIRRAPLTPERVKAALAHA